MLKYTLNINDKRPDIVPIPYSEYIDIDYSNVDEYKRLVAVTLSEEFDINVGDTVSCMVSARTTDINNVNHFVYFHSNFTVSGYNDINKQFTVVVDKYRKLDSILASINDVAEYAYKEDPTYVITEYEYYALDEKERDNYEPAGSTRKMVTMYFNVNHNLPNYYASTPIIYLYYRLDYEKKMTPIYVQVIDDKTIAFDYNEGMSYMFAITDDYSVPFEVDGIDIYADSLFFQPEYYDNLSKSMGLIRYTTGFNVPLTTPKGTDLFSERMVKEKFVDSETQKSITSVIDFEKDIYYPVYQIDKNNFDEIKQIDFNFHFREREGDNWMAKAGGLWNSENIKDKKSGCYDKSSQSDLLGYIGFTNGDVKFQKNKLKKSFIRLSYFDNMDSSTQTLVSTSTMFMNSSELLSKYMRNNTLDTTVKNSPQDYRNNNKSISGIRVDYEPYWSKDESFNDDMFREAYRLSTRVSVRDKYSSNSSSEGFYLYLYKDDNRGYEESDIYLQVAFNHAGFGRILSMMMPFDKNTKNVKTFETILSDWKEPNNGYSFRDYLSYSYIRFKCKYDKDMKKHIYYINTNVNNDGFYNKDTLSYDKVNHILTINLYEANMHLG